MDQLARRIVMALIAGPLAAIGAAALLFRRNLVFGLMISTTGSLVAPIAGAIITAASVQKQPAITGTGSDV